MGRLFLELTGCGWSLFAEVNHHVFREAALIFMAKASVCLRVRNKPLPPQVAAWIG